MVYRILLIFFIANTSVHAQGVLSVIGNISIRQGYAVVDTIPTPPDTTDYTPTVMSSVALGTRNISFEMDSTHYNGFPTVTYVSGNKRSIIYGHRVTHTYTPGNEMDELYSTDGGHTWANKTVLAVSGKEVTNWGGGGTRDGKTVVLLYRILSGSIPGTQEGQFYKTSHDGGNTYTTSGTLHTPCDSCISAFYGRVCEDGGGNLIQPYYLISYDQTKSYVYLQRSTDTGKNWSQFGAIGATESASHILNEASLCWLSGGNIIAMIRTDLSETTIQAYVYNSTDSGHTWTLKGYLYDGNGFLAAGTAPVLVRKNDSTATVITTNRGAINNLSRFDLKFGTNMGNGTVYTTGLGRPSMDANNIDFGYAGPVLFNGTDLDSNALIAYYQTSPLWNYDSAHYTNNHIVDINLTPLYRDSIATLTRTSTTYANGTYFTGSGYLYDEIGCYGPPYQLYIRQSGNYAIDVKADFDTTNTDGTFRTITVQQFNGGSYVSDFSSVTQDNNHSAFNTTATGILTAGQNIQVLFNHDSGAPLTGPVTITIRKI